MKHIETFHRRLNLSRSGSAAENSTFKIHIDLILQAEIRHLNHTNNACIIGAGSGHDFSLPVFIEAFANVVATDVDEMSLAALIGNQKNVKGVAVEYSGLQESGFFADFKERIVNARTPEKIDQIIDHKLDMVRTHRFLENMTAAFDLIYVSPIHTQLVYQQVLSECALLRERGYPPHLIQHIERKMLDAMPDILDRFNANLVALLHPEGRLVVASDIFELHEGSDFHRRVTNSIKNADVMHELHQNYVDKYGMGLGDYGLYNLDERLIVTKQRWLLWEFDEHRSFAVKLKAYKHFSIEGGTT